MFGEWTYHYTLLRNVNRVGNEAKNNPSGDFLTVNGTGTGHKAYNTASYMMMDFPASQEMPTFYETPKFIKMFRTASYWSLSWTG